MRVNLSWDTGLLLLSTMLAATPALARPWKSTTAAADRPVANTTRAYATEYWSPLTAEVSGVEAIQLLVRRQLPRRLHHAFEFTLDASLGGNASDFDRFKVTKDGSKIRITGATTPALSRGLLTYLRKIGGDITWWVLSDLAYPNLTLRVAGPGQRSRISYMANLSILKVWKERPGANTGASRAHEQLRASLRQNVRTGTS